VLGKTEHQDMLVSAQGSSLRIAARRTLLLCLYPVAHLGLIIEGGSRLEQS
jgi:hypothetical protein